MVDSKIGELKESSNKDGTTINLANQNERRTEDTYHTGIRLGTSQRDDIGKVQTTEYENRILASIKENELAMKHNEDHDGVDTKPLIQNDESSISNVKSNDEPKVDRPLSASKTLNLGSIATGEEVLVKGDTIQHVPTSENKDEGSYEKIMKYLKTQEDAEKKRNEHQTDELTTAKTNGELLSEPKRPSRKNVGSSNLNDKSDDSGNPSDNSSLNQIEITDFGSTSEIIKDSEANVVPDKLGFKSVGTQTIRFRQLKSSDENSDVEPSSCRCCCTCNKSFNS